MLFSRMSAALCTLLLIAVVALGIIMLGNTLAPFLAHGQQVEHLAGKLQAGKGPQEFVLVTSNNIKLTFQCQQRCLKQTEHIKRHIKERANTDVYFQRGLNGVLIAIDVD